MKNKIFNLDFFIKLNFSMLFIFLGILLIINKFNIKIQEWFMTILLKVITANLIVSGICFLLFIIGAVALIREENKKNGN